MSSIIPPLGTAGGPPSVPAQPGDAEAVPLPYEDSAEDLELKIEYVRAPSPDSPAVAVKQLAPTRVSDRRPSAVELTGLQLLRIDEILGGEGRTDPAFRPVGRLGGTAGRAVASERRAQPAMFVAQPEPEGSLLNLEPARLMGWAIATGFCGCLWLAPEGVVQPVGGPVDHPSSSPHRELYFEHGMLLGAHSTVVGDGLVDVLAVAWSSPQAQRARSIIASAPPRNLREQLGRLSRARLVDAKDVPTRLHGYVVELVYRALAPTPGRYRLLPRALTVGERVTPPVSPRLLLVEGLRRRTSLDQLERHLGPIATELVPVAAALAQQGGVVLRDLGLTAAEEIALRCFDDELSLAEVMQRAELGEHATYVLAYALLCLGALAVPGALPTPIRPPVAVRPPPLPSPASRAAAATHELETAIARVQSKHSQVECADYFTLLELPRDAATIDVWRAHERLRAQFLPSAQPYRCRMAMERELRQIILLLDEARVVLGDDALRTAYRAGLPA